MRLRSELAGARPRESYVNAYVDQQSIVLVHRAGGQLVTRRVPADACCFIRHEAMTDELYRMFKSSKLVKALATEGHWFRVVWANQYEAGPAAAALLKHDIETYEGDLSPVRRYCVDHDVAVQQPRRAYLDLETDSRVSFSHKEQMRILCWCVVDHDTGQEITGCLQADTDQAERVLLDEMWRTLEPYDQVLAWNGDRFDFFVIRSRCKLVGCSVDWRRWLWLDHMKLFDRQNVMAAESGEEKSSLALQAIATAVIGEGKADFDSSKTWEAWSAGGEERARMVRYCVKDVQLMRAIELKTGYVELFQTLCEVCGVFPDSRGLAPGNQVESFLLRLAKAHDHHFPTKLRGDGAEYEAFKGAFVMEPTEKGIVRNVHVADFASLYPSIILTWNMSPETRVLPKITLFHQPLYLPRPIDSNERQEGEAEAALVGTRFRLGEPGILPTAVGELLKLRKVWNERKAAATPGTDAWKTADRRSTAYKIAANSFYGVIGSSASRFFDRAVGEAVTQSGVWLIKETIRAAEARGLRAIYGDTDSVFVAGCTREEFAQFVGWCNTDLYPGLLAGKGCRENHVKLAYEKQFERVVFCTAKRYVGRYSHYKGTAATAESKPEIKGLEFKRGDSVRLARKLQEEIVYMLVGYRVPASEVAGDFEAVIERHQRHVLEGELGLDDVVIAKGLAKDLDDYPKRYRKDGGEFVAQPHIQIAKLMQARGQDVGSGTKVRYFCLDGTSSPKKYLPAADWSGEVDRFDLWDALVWPPAKRVLEAAFPGHDWARWDRTRPTKPRAARGRRKVQEQATDALPWGQVPERQLGPNTGYGHQDAK